MGNKHPHENKHDLETKLECYKNVHAAGSNINMQLGMDDAALASCKEKHDDDTDRITEPTLLLKLNHIAKIAGNSNDCSNIFKVVMIFA